MMFSFLCSFNISPHYISMHIILIVENVQEYPFYFFGGGGAYVSDQIEKSHHLYPLNHYGHYVLQFHHILIS